MNEDEVNELARTVTLAGLAALAAKFHLDPTQPLLLQLGADLAAVAVVAWKVYAHWNMIKVPENSTVTPPTQTPALGGIERATNAYWRV